MRFSGSSLILTFNAVLVIGNPLAAEAAQQQ